MQFRALLEAYAAAAKNPDADPNRNDMRRSSRYWNETPGRFARRHAAGFGAEHDQLSID